MNWIALALVVFGLSQLVKKYIFSFALVNGESMEPWLSPGDLVFLSKWDKNYVPGDMIALRLNADSPILVKRLIASGPATFFMENGVAYVSEVPYPESLREPPQIDTSLYWCLFTAKIEIPLDSIFVLGDNRCRSSDSRVFGPLNRDDIYGKVRMRILRLPKIVLSIFSK